MLKFLTVNNILAPSNIGTTFFFSFFLFFFFLFFFFGTHFVFQKFVWSLD